MEKVNFVLNCHESQLEMNMTFSVWGAVPPRPSAVVTVPSQPIQSSYAYVHKSSDNQ